MLTYRTGVAGSPSGATAMVAHLSEPTLASAHAAIAAYYAGATGPDPSEVEAFTHTVAQLRRDLDPALARLLALDTGRAPTREEIAHLLTGTRADGRPIPGRQVQRGSHLSLAAELGLDPNRIATAEEVDRILAGCRADIGDRLPEARAALLRRRFLALYGVEERAGAIPLTEALPHLRAGRRGDGAALRRAAYTDALTAARQQIAFIDLTLSAEKSFSVAVALAPTEGERALLMAAHRGAVEEVLRVAETVIGRARRGKAGRGGAEVGAIAWLSFEHMSARPTAEIARIDPTTGQAYTQLQTVQVPGDPQVHHHAIVPSCVLTPSGHVGGLDLAALAGRVHELGALLHAATAVRLRQLGVEVVLDERTGAGRLSAIPDRLRDAFSKRTQAGTEAAKAYAAARGLDWDGLDGASRIALLKSGTQDPRGAKRDDLGDFAVWQDQAAALGWTPGSFIDLDRPIPEPSGEDRLEAAYQAAARLLGTAFRNGAVLEEATVRTAAARGLIAGGYRGPDDVDAVVGMLRTRGLMQDGVATQLIVEPVRGSRGQSTYRATTTLHAEREERLVTLARAAAQDRSAALTRQEVEAAARASGLDFGGAHGQAQFDAMVALGTGPRLAAMTGSAGSGKSAVIAPLARAWSEAGRRVFGISTAWRTAQALGEAGITQDACLATAALLARVEAGRIVLEPRDVVVVDEVGLMATRTLLDLLELRERCGFTLVAVGDDLQATPVEAGSPLVLLRRALGDEAVPVIATTVRQRQAEERALAGMARAGRIGEVLEVMREAGRARLAAGSYEEAAAAAAALWAERRAAHIGETGFTIAVVAPTNADARAVSQAMRHVRQARGEVGPDEVKIEAVDQSGGQFELNLARGDQIRLYQRVNARGSGSRGLLGVNGSVVEVVEIGAAGLVLRNGMGRQGLVVWTTLRDPVTGRYRLTLGGCLSVDQAQGLTSDEAILALPGGSGSCDAGRTYVALSRHRSQAFVVLGEAAERRAVARHQPLGSVGRIGEREIWRHASKALSRRRERAGALDVLDQARACREHLLAVRRTAHARMEARMDGPTTVPARLRRRTIARIVAVLDELRARRAAVLDTLSRRLAEMLDAERNTGACPGEQSPGARPQHRPGADAPGQSP